MSHAPGCLPVHACSLKLWVFFHAVSCVFNYCYYCLFRRQRSVSLITWGSWWSSPSPWERKWRSSTQAPTLISSWEQVTKIILFIFHYLYSSIWTCWKNCKLCWAQIEKCGVGLTFFQCWTKVYSRKPLSVYLDFVMYLYPINLWVDNLKFKSEVKDKFNSLISYYLIIM